MTTNPILIGLGAGLVSAILFATTISGTPLALLLSYVAPLPVLIVGLGWTPLAAVLAVATGGAALSLFLQSKIALVFALGIGTPAAALSYVALTRLRDARTGLEVWLPLGLVLAGVPLLAAFVTLAGAFTLATDFARYTQLVTGAVEALVRLQVERPGGGGVRLPEGVSVADIARLLVTALPFVMGASFTMLFSANLWAAAKAVAISGRLPRPWMPMPTLRLPVAALGLLGAGLVLTTFGDFAGLFGLALAGGITAALALQGLAGVHLATVGKPTRPLLLGLTYALLLVVQVWAVPILTLYGLLIVLGAMKPTAPPKPPLQIS